jgi:hypothetical protein
MKERMEGIIVYTLPPHSVLLHIRITHIVLRFHALHIYYIVPGPGWTKRVNVMTKGWTFRNGPFGAWSIVCPQGLRIGTT